LLENRANLGGAIMSLLVTATLSVSDSEIRQNTAVETGGGVYAFASTATLQRVTVEQNQATLFDGGGLVNDEANMTVTDSHIFLNRARNSGGLLSTALLGNATLTVRNSEIDNNIAVLGGGAIGNFAGGDQTAALVVANSLLHHNAVTSTAPMEGLGGAIFNGFFADAITSTAIITLTDSTVHHNTAQNGGAIANANATATAQRRGIVTIRRSTIHDNAAGGAIDQSGNGGGIVNVNSSLDIANSTLSANVAGGTGTNGSGLGGAIANTSLGLPSRVQIINGTVATNTATVAGGAIANVGLGGNPNVTLRNTLFAHNQAGVGPDSCVNQNGTLLSLGSNLEDGDTCELNLADDLPNTIALIGGLADNGGPTPTHALLSGSPAIDAGNSPTCNAAPINGVDQRGAPRTNTTCDIGAFEFSRDLFFPHVLRTAPIAQQ
jgi:hypothetical protein